MKKISEMTQRGKLKNTFKFNLKILARILSVLGVVGSLGTIVVTGIFMFNILNDISGGHFKLAEDGRDSVTSINLKKLNELVENIHKKNQLDQPREGRLNNPFLDPHLKTDLNN